MLPSSQLTGLLKHIHTRALCVLLLIMPRSLPKCRILCTCSFSLSQAKFPSCSCWHLQPLGFWMLRKSPCISCSSLGSTQPSPESPVYREYFWIILGISDSIFKAISQSSNCVSSWLNYLQSSSAIKYRSL